MEFPEDHTLHSSSPTPMGRPWVTVAFGVLQLCMHKVGRESMTDMLSTAVLFERVDAMDAEELDRLQAAIAVVCWFKRMGSITPQEGLVYRRFSRFEEARFDRSWTTCPTSTKYR